MSVAWPSRVHLLFFFLLLQIFSDVVWRLIVSGQLIVSVRSHGGYHF